MQTIWQEDIKEDFNMKRLYREGSLQSSFYYHLRRRIGDTTLNYYNAFLYTEFRYKGKRVDLALVIRYDDDQFVPVAIFEFKYLAIVSDALFMRDVEKVLDFIDSTDECIYYLGFIQEAEYSDMTDNFSWLTQEQADMCKGRLVELTGGLSKPNEEAMWIVR